MSSDSLHYFFINDIAGLNSFMQLWCIVIQDKHNKSAQLYKATSMVLVMLLLLAFVFPAIHSHHNDAPTTHSEKQITIASKKCPICSFLSHQEHHKYLVPTDHPSIQRVSTYTTILTGVFAGVYKFTLQGFTNKGPPLAAIA
ncbi:hypothetical protein [Pedobacter quisquiliarum]|jgi:hypothetical protein|uniref:hypothetical protein n=1 Tax=Pedobacter quisquiliarum TaxID=1834438 RepID=UPI00166AA43F|nr:hypothetical protein [Pedobacter quisquiliarum]